VNPLVPTGPPPSARSCSTWRSFPALPSCGGRRGSEEHRRGRGHLGLREDRV